MTLECVFRWKMAYTTYWLFCRTRGINDGIIVLGIFLNRLDKLIHRSIYPNLLLVATLPHFSLPHGHIPFSCMAATEPEVEGNDMTATVGDRASWSISRPIQKISNPRFAWSSFLTLSRSHLYHVTFTFLRNQLCKLIDVDTISNVFELGTRGSILAILLHSPLSDTNIFFLICHIYLDGSKGFWTREIVDMDLYMKHFSIPLFATVYNKIHIRRVGQRQQSTWHHKCRVRATTRW